MKQTNRVRVSKFSLSQDLIINALKRENEQLKKDKKQLIVYIAKMKSEIERQAKGIVGILHGG